MPAKYIVQIPEAVSYNLSTLRRVEEQLCRHRYNAQPVEETLDAILGIMAEWNEGIAGESYGKDD